MKRLFQNLLLAMLVSGLLAADAGARMPGKLGFKAGLNFARMSGGDTDNLDSRNGLVGGVFLHLGLAKGVSFQPELLFSQKGAKGVAIEDGSGARADVTLKMNYLEVPILLKYSFGPGPATPCLFAGPAFAYNQSSKTEIATSFGDLSLSGTVDNYKEKSLDVGLVLGAGVDLKLGTSLVLLDLRYTMGLNSAWNDVTVADAPSGEFPYYDENTGEADDMKNQALSLTVGLMF